MNLYDIMSLRAPSPQRVAINAFRVGGAPPKVRRPDAMALLNRATVARGVVNEPGQVRYVLGSGSGNLMGSGSGNLMGLGVLPQVVAPTSEAFSRTAQELLALGLADRKLQADKRAAEGLQQEAAQYLGHPLAQGLVSTLASIEARVASTWDAVKTKAANVAGDIDGQLASMPEWMRDSMRPSLVEQAGVKIVAMMAPLYAEYLTDVPVALGKVKEAVQAKNAVVVAVDRKEAATVNVETAKANVEAATSAGQAFALNAQLEAAEKAMDAANAAAAAAAEKAASSAKAATKDETKTKSNTVYYILGGIAAVGLAWAFTRRKR